MKRMFLLMSIMLFLFPALCFADSDIAGFREFKWETPKANFQELIIDHKEDDAIFYKLPNDKLNIGDIKVDDILYNFYKDKLATVVINFTGQEKYDYLLKALEEKYGASEQPNEFMEQHVWFNRTGNGEIEYSDVTNKGFIMLWSKKLSAEQEAEKAKSAQTKGSNDL